jgi:hypothetical protein
MRDAARPTVGDSAGTEVSLEFAAAQRVRADSCRAGYSAIGFAHADRVSLEQSASGAIISGTTRMADSAAIVACGGSLRIENAATPVVIGGAVEAQRVLALAVVAGSVEGRVNALMGTRAAIAFGVALGLSALLARLLRRWI